MGDDEFAQDVDLRPEARRSFVLDERSVWVDKRVNDSRRELYRCYMYALLSSEHKGTGPPILAIKVLGLPLFGCTRLLYLFAVVSSRYTLFCCTFLTIIFVFC